MHCSRDPDNAGQTYGARYQGNSFSRLALFGKWEAEPAGRDGQEIGARTDYADRERQNENDGKCSIQYSDSQVAVTRPPGNQSSARVIVAENYW
jgi:hypothetical protein